MISCKRATELLSKAVDEKLSIRERLALNIHVRICSYCKEFGSHIKSLHQVFKLDEGAHLNAKLPSKKKEEIIEEMKKRQE